VVDQAPEVGPQIPVDRRRLRDPDLIARLRAGYRLAPVDVAVNHHVEPERGGDDRVALVLAFEHVDAPPAARPVQREQRVDALAGPRRRALERVAVAESHARLGHPGPPPGQAVAVHRVLAAGEFRSYQACGRSSHSSSTIRRVSG
jgi:hypothetical protein